MFGWDGDTLAWESSPAQADGASGKTVHYLYEPGTFVPVAQALRHQPMRLLAQTSYTGAYDIDQDPLWTHTPPALPIDVLAVTRRWFRWPVLDGVYDITFRTERFVLFLNQHLSSLGSLLVLSNIRRCVGEPSPHFLYPFIQFGSGP